MYVLTFYFFFFFVNIALTITLPPGLYNFLSVSGSGAYEGNAGVGRKVVLNVTNTDLRVVSIYDDNSKR